MKEESSEGVDVVSTGLFGLSAALMAMDIVADVFEGTSSAHLVIEFAAMLVALGGGVRLWRRWRRLRRSAVGSRVAHERAEASAMRWKAEAERWRGEAETVLRGLGVEMDRQFERWRLSPAEREVGLLLVKGLALKEVAAVRGTAERTARDQARAVYRKAELGGRAELAAFFLEDLLLPVSAAGS